VKAYIHGCLLLDITPNARVLDHLYIENVLYSAPKERNVKVNLKCTCVKMVHGIVFRNHTSLS